ncbi:hypothetical protein DFH07DRAFT_942741 [Mycena maculata]|uniref:Uncharacterized protein n=1 Tax=Mycena maculata TaxID=230809 RepID=A0AAD7ILH3_9AGAR|nr:hypothetical protein DFH07DRAFT_942741 [Mycena maculata]
MYSPSDSAPTHPRTRIPAPRDVKAVRLPHTPARPRRTAGDGDEGSTSPRPYGPRTRSTLLTRMPPISGDPHAVLSLPKRVLRSSRTRRQHRGQINDPGGHRELQRGFLSAACTVKKDPECQRPSVVDYAHYRQGRAEQGRDGGKSPRLSLPLPETTTAAGAAVRSGGSPPSSRRADFPPSHALADEERGALPSSFDVHPRGMEEPYRAQSSPGLARRRAESHPLHLACRSQSREATGRLGEAGAHLPPRPNGLPHAPAMSEGHQIRRIQLRARKVAPPSPLLCHAPPTTKLWDPLRRWCRFPHHRRRAVVLKVGYSEGAGMVGEGGIEEKMEGERASRNVDRAVGTEDLKVPPAVNGAGVRRWDPRRRILHPCGQDACKDLATWRGEGLQINIWTIFGLPIASGSSVDCSGPDRKQLVSFTPVDAVLRRVELQSNVLHCNRRAQHTSSSQHPRPSNIDCIRPEKFPASHSPDCHAWFS